MLIESQRIAIKMKQLRQRIIFLFCISSVMICFYFGYILVDKRTVKYISSIKPDIMSYSNFLSDKAQIDPYLQKDYAFPQNNVQMRQGIVNFDTVYRKIHQEILDGKRPLKVTFHGPNKPGNGYANRM